MSPADDDVAFVGGVAVQAEVGALIFKLDAHRLPAIGGHAALGKTIRESCLHAFDEIAQFGRQHAKEENDSRFFGRLVTQGRQVDGIAAPGTISQAVVWRSGKFVGTPTDTNKVNALCATMKIWIPVRGGY